MLSQRSNKPNMSSNHFGSLNINEKCSNFKKVAPTNTSDSSPYMYHACLWNADVEYSDRVRMGLCSHMGSINFADPAKIRMVHEELMSQVRTEAICISNKHKF